MEEILNPCPVTYCLERIGGKWKPLLLFLILHGINRFGLLQKQIPAISKQALTTQLRELERDGLITRTIYAEVPPRVEYALSENGESLLEVLRAMKTWGEAQMQRDSTATASSSQGTI
ncbi:MAG: helix-turn-helix domain-containing protein [Gallionella sp.]|nr:helix-turn-helix domain-containing protein [Gallionella sp.]MDD4958892.1 helix-turn-helix domain-containing protein [Gallionella sp.]